jgi:hypothetical protein
MRKVSIILALCVVLGMAAWAFAGALADLDGKEFWFLLTDKDGKATGWIHEGHAKTVVDGKTAIQSFRHTYDKASNKTTEMVYVRESNNPMLSLTVKVNGAVTLTGKSVKDGFELVSEGKTKLLKKGDVDLFSYDDQGLFEGVKVNEPKKYKVWDVVKNAKTEYSIKAYGPDEIQHDGKKFSALKFDLVEGTSLTKYWVAKETLAPISTRNENYNYHSKRCNKDEVVKAFPNVK